ncbi:hypothetical protein MNB_SV-12-557 [hydrothermal vent metagenome]|uniref:Uncharacterized protein n=1 Tax=hydrothermal vent metagenome TaxID=652676 RepID=A0A1W1CPA6_9ZZZZ
MKILFKEVHEAWLATQFTGFISKTQSRQELYEFANILFKHLTWLENDFIKNGIEYNYSIQHVPIRVTHISHMFNNILERLTSIESKLESCKDEDITYRMRSDIEYIKAVLKRLPEEKVEDRFDSNREYPNVKLTQRAKDALTLFLFEESYKEYELIMVYNYSKANSNDAFLNRIYQILIDESLFHLRSFSQMMADMGILGVPRTLMEEIYKFDDLEQFLKDGIQEEIGAKEECKRLAEAVSDSSEHFASFFTFINNQENYHIALMEEALAYIKGGIEV